MTVKDESGDEASHISPGDTYTVECRLENKGGLPARNTHVELYVEQKADDATIDTNAPPGSDPATGSVEIARSGGPELSGFTTVPHGSRLELMIFPKGTRDDLLALQRDVVWWATVRVNETREFETDTVEAHIDHHFDDEDREFVLRVYDTSWIVGEPDDDYGVYDAILTGNRLTEVPATIVDGEPDNQKRRLPLESSVSSSDTDRIEKTHTDVPPSGETTVSFEYTPSAAEDFRGMSVFSVRAYTIASSDTPENWDRLDHTRSRFVGRTEVRGRILQPPLEP